MNEIANIEKRLKEAQRLADEYNQNVLAEPNNFAYKLSLKSMETEVERLQRELMTLKAEREVEVLELRFLGQQAEAGSLPLHLIGELLKKFSDALYDSSYYCHFGRERKSGRLPAHLMQLMDLRLSDIAPGSTRVYITGRLSPDLFGQSLLEDTLSGTVALLSAESPDDIADAVNEVGIMGARRMSGFLNGLSAANLEVELNWQTPHDEKVHWLGESKTIKSLSQSLERIERKTKNVWIKGRVWESSMRGRVEIKGEDGEHFVCTFPQNLYETVRQFPIGDNVLAHIEVNTYVKLATGAAKRRYRLLTMRDPEKFKGIEHL